jgi:hypothetical protein
MATISNDPKIGYIYDQTGDAWHPLISSGVVPHQHAASAIPGFTQLINASASFLTITSASNTYLSKTGTETATNKTLTSPTINGGTVNNATTITLTGNQALNSFRNRNVWIDTANPPVGGGNDGDIWIKYIP